MTDFAKFRGVSTSVPRAQAVWLKKFGAPAQDAADAARQMRFLAARGFAGDTIWRVVKGGANDEIAGDH